MSSGLRQKIGSKYYEMLGEFFDSVVTSVAKFLYKEQNSIPFRESPKTPEKVITYEKVCKNCEIDIDTLKNKLNHPAAKWVFEIYSCSFNDNPYEGIGLKHIGIAWLEEKFKNIHEDFFSVQANPGNNKPSYRLYQEW
jgi:hypothetical protein